MKSRVCPGLGSSSSGFVNTAETNNSVNMGVSEAWDAILPTSLREGWLS